jgi:hypothetical protein
VILRRADRNLPVATFALEGSRLVRNPRLNRQIGLLTLSFIAQAILLAAESFAPFETLTIIHLDGPAADVPGQLSMSSSSVTFDGVEITLIGGAALNIHGQLARPTEDLDLVLGMSVESAVQRLTARGWHRVTLTGY